MSAGLSRFVAPLVAGVFLLLYWPVAFVTGDNFAAELLRTGEGTVMNFIFVMFFLKLRRAFSNDDEIPDSARRFYLGLLLWSGAGSLGAWWRLIWRMGGAGPELAWMITNDWANYLIWVTIVGVFLMLSGPAIPGDKLGDMKPSTPLDISWKRLLLAAGLCAAAAYVIVILRVGSGYVNAMLHAPP